MPPCGGGAGGADGGGTLFADGSEAVSVVAQPDSAPTKSIPVTRSCMSLGIRMGFLSGSRTARVPKEKQCELTHANCVAAKGSRLAASSFPSENPLEA